jgi:Glyoxalase/Bleomycin resistance protein/Dioxygenase superfamily
MARARFRVCRGVAARDGKRDARANDAGRSADHDGTGQQGLADANPSETQIATMGIFIYLADVDSHYERARQVGAEIVQAPYDEPYGRTYTVRDLDGHPWFFTHAPELVASLALVGRGVGQLSAHSA